MAYRSLVVEASSVPVKLFTATFGDTQAVVICESTQGPFALGGPGMTLATGARFPSNRELYLPLTFGDEVWAATGEPRKVWVLIKSLY